MLRQRRSEQNLSGASVASVAAVQQDRASPQVVTPTWSTVGEALAVVLVRRHLRKTVQIAAVVGTLLFCINQLDVVLNGDATAVVWLKVALTYVVPFGVSNFGILVATRRR